MAVYLVLVLVAFASSLDQIGPITRTLKTMPIFYKQFQELIRWIPLQQMLMFQTLLQSLTGDVKGLKIAVPKEYLR